MRFPEGRGNYGDCPYAVYMACAEAEPTDSGVEPWLELGTGETEFVALDNGDEVPLVYGPQGGWHVDTTARFGGIELDGASLTYVATDPDDGAVLNYPYDAQLNPSLLQEIDGGWLRLGDRVVFDIGSDEEILGRDVRLEVTLTDAGGASLSASHEVVVVSP